MGLRSLEVLLAFALQAPLAEPHRRIRIGLPLAALVAEAAGGGAVVRACFWRLGGDGRLLPSLPHEPGFAEVSTPVLWRDVAAQEQWKTAKRRWLVAEVSERWLQNRHPVAQ